MRQVDHERAQDALRAQHALDIEATHRKYGEQLAELQRKLMDCRAEALDEAADLRNVIRAHEGTLVGVRIKVGAMYHEDVLEAVQRAMNGKAQAEREANALRRQLEATQAELDQVRQERARAQRALRVQELEQSGLYDCHGQPFK